MLTSRIRQALAELGVAENERVQFAKLPSRSGKKGRLVLACFVDHERVPRYIVKIPREDSNGSSLEEEHNALAEVRARLDSGMLDSVPLDLIFRENPPILVQTYLPGLNSYLAIQSSGFERAVEATLHWLARFQKAMTSREILLLDWVDEAIETTQSVRASSPWFSIFPESTNVITKALAVIAERASTSSSRRVKCQLIHGDFTPFNVRVRPPDGLAVVDWEGSCVRPAAYDYFSYLNSVKYLYPKEPIKYFRIVAKTEAELHSHCVDLDADGLSSAFGLFLLSQLVEYGRRQMHSSHIRWWLEEVSRYAANPG